MDRTICHIASLVVESKRNAIWGEESRRVGEENSPGTVRLVLATESRAQRIVGMAHDSNRNS